MSHKLKPLGHRTNLFFEDRNDNQQLDEGELYVHKGSGVLCHPSDLLSTKQKDQRSGDFQTGESRDDSSFDLSKLYEVYNLFVIKGSNNRDEKLYQKGDDAYHFQRGELEPVSHQTVLNLMIDAGKPNVNKKSIWLRPERISDLSSPSVQLNLMIEQINHGESEESCRVKREYTGIYQKAATINNDDIYNYMLVGPQDKVDLVYEKMKSRGFVISSIVEHNIVCRPQELD